MIPTMEGCAVMASNRKVSALETLKNVTRGTLVACLVFIFTLCLLPGEYPLRAQDPPAGGETAGDATEDDDENENADAR
ncbi:MAG: hypothetical protein AAEJ65_00915, partial [Planctomycetota bacterium]